MTIILSIITVVLLSISVWQIVKIFEVSNLDDLRAPELVQGVN